MTKKRRNNLEIAADILRVAKRGAKKTHIVYKANLNFNILHEYLDELTDAGLIENDIEGNGTIKTTEKGVQYLNYYHGLKQFMNPMIP
ncbi:hypothetical protein KAS14_03320 [Candidatus Bathyarchaeota archaeon]|nr:hypothetical protein [Candidatus Bathyarchaeota archaeon]